MTEGPPYPAADNEQHRAAKRLLRRTFVAYVVFALLSAVALATGFIMPAPETHAEAGTRNFIEGLLIMLFFSATIIGLGLQWTANIVAARRYNHDNPYPAASVIAGSQLVVFAVYAAVVLFVVYYRMRGGQPRAIIPGIASVLAGIYFLRMPAFLLQGLYSRKDKDGPARGGTGQ